MYVVEFIKIQPIHFIAVYLSLSLPVSEVIMDDLTCAFCRDKVNPEDFELSCHHCHHFECFETYYLEHFGRDCPWCRNDISEPETTKLMAWVGARLKTLETGPQTELETKPPQK